VRELFTPNESIILVKPNDPDDLAAKIIALKRDPPLRERIADRGHEIFRRHASIEAVGKELNQALLSLLFHER